MVLISDTVTSQVIMLPGSFCQVFYYLIDSLNTFGRMSRVKRVQDAKPFHRQTVVLLHGFLASKKYWRRVEKNLQRQGHHVVAIDLLGFGKASKARASEYTYDEHVAYIEQQLVSLNIKGSFILVGHSLGSLLAVRYALTFPERVLRLGLMNPPLYISPKQALETLHGTGWLYRLLLDGRQRFVLWQLLRTARVFSAHSRMSREKTLHNVIIPAKFFADLEKLPHTAMMLVGEYDRSVYLENLASWQQPSNIDVRVIKSGHHAPITYHRQVSQCIAQLSAARG